MAEPVVELHLRDYLDIARRRKVLLASLVLLALGAAIAASALATPQYRATARVRVEGGGSSSILDDNTNQSSNVRSRNLQNEVEFAKSDRVALRASEEFGNDIQASVSAATDADILTFTATGVDKDRAAEVANTFADAYVSERSLAAGERFLAAVGVINDRLETISRSRLELEAQLLTSTDSSSVRIQLDSLASEEARLRGQLNEIDVLSQLENSASVGLLNAAVAPKAPFSPSWVRNIGFAIVAGLVLAAGAALVLESLDDTILTKRDLENATDGISVLALIPPPGKSRIGQRRERHLVTSRTGPFTEGFRSLRSAIELGQTLDSDISSILVTSANASEGKSTVAAHLAIAFARSGANVLVLDADMHNPTQHDLFGIANRNGLAEQLSCEGNAETVVEQASGEGLLSVIPAGSSDSTPSELLRSQPAHDFIQKMTDIYDLVIIDSPPLRPVTDTLPLARIADATLLVSMRGQTNAAEVEEALELLARAKTRPLGAVLCGVDQAQNAYGYGTRNR